MPGKILLNALLVIFILFSSAAAYDGIDSIEEYASPGTLRQYIFTAQDTMFGTLNVTFEGKEEFENSPAYLFNAELSFDYSAIGNPVQMNITDQYYVNQTGIYLGNHMKASVAAKKQELYLKHEADSIKGYFIDSGVKEERAIPISGDIRAIDNNMIYQIELFLSFTDFSVGDTISETFFIPQVMITSPFEMVVEDYRPVRYGELVDSAYVLHMTTPQEQYIYFSPDHKVLKVEITGQQINITLNEDIHEKFKPVPDTSGGLSDFLARLPLYLVYLFIILIFMAPFLRWHFHKIEIYFIFLIGCAMFPLISSTQVPLQKWYSVEVLIPAVRSGASLFTYGTVSAMIGGFIQEILKLIPILLAFFFRNPDRRTLVVYGVFAGLGFGFYEACSVTGAAFQTGAMGILSWGLFERIFAILFHATSAALLGWALGKGWIRLIIIWILVSLLHSLENYSILLVQKQMIDVKLFELMIAFTNLIFLAIVWLTTRSRKP